MATKTATVRVSVDDTLLREAFERGRAAGQMDASEMFTEAIAAMLLSNGGSIVVTDKAVELLDDNHCIEVIRNHLDGTWTYTLVRREESSGD